MSHADMITPFSASVGRNCLHWALTNTQSALRAATLNVPALQPTPLLKRSLQTTPCATIASISEQCPSRGGFQSLGRDDLQHSSLPRLRGIHSQPYWGKSVFLSPASSSSSLFSPTPQCHGGTAAAHASGRNSQPSTQSRCSSSDSASTSSRSADESVEPPSESGVRVAVGSIHLIMGPMFAGKTTALLARMQDAVSAGKKIALVKSGIDVRYGLTDVVSHDGTRMPCLAVNTLQDFRTTIGDAEYDELEVIGIDEAQFFSDLDAFCRQAADRDHKELVVAGLDGDFKRRKFGQLLDLVPTADSIVKLSATCELCKQPASFTLRTTEETETQVVGGADKYMPVCRKHWVEGTYAIKMARTFLRRSKVGEPAPAAK
ncbi:Thymidine kinase [Klebsormidium nitens]|uniref:thymidine kinase n=1 Tax=Klebsormidium nitens TaxID=105231 RepID=A0A1Y1HUR1_KLENI|nr:Thymidine kinase [Klebsormidium nitens]|eukprot:GAQ80919.1 Thymidine kinase [Klebsormidium nitens]